MSLRHLDQWAACRYWGSSLYKAGVLRDWQFDISPALWEEGAAGQ